jgi:DNA-3-methyladenine glycosylase I
MKRCAWAEGSPELRSYHDEEWGVPRYDEAILFEMLVLESFQAGLSWNLILRKRDAFRRAFDGFDPERIATYGGREVARLLGDEGIVRSRAKIAATIANANAYLAMRDRGERLSELAWSFVDGEPIVGGRSVPTQSVASEGLSAALKARGYSFVGAVTMYSFMQAVGMVNDHAPDCFRRDGFTRA